MAQVNVDLSEYDMLRKTKAKAEKEAAELKEEVKKLKDNASNVVVKNRYYIPSLDYDAAASRIISNLGTAGIFQLQQLADNLYRHTSRNPFNDPVIEPDAIRRFSELIKYALKGMLNMRGSYCEDAVHVEVRGFDEVADSIRAKFEEQYKATFELKERELDQAKERYTTEKLKVDEAVDRAEDALRKKYEAKIEKLENKIADLESEKKELSKSSQEKMAEAVEKLRAAQAEVDALKGEEKEKVVYIKEPRKKLFGIF